MSEELDLLREIGAQKIYEETHIPLKHAQSVIHESFEGLTKVQFLGFISILEREYNEDFSSLRAKGIKYFDDEPEKEVMAAKVFVETKKGNKTTLAYILIAVVIFIFVAFSNFDSNSSKSIQTKVDNTTIESAQKNLQLSDTDLNLTKQGAESVTVLEKVKVVEEVKLAKKVEILEVSKVVEGVKAVEKSKEVREIKAISGDQVLKIVAKSKLWIGYINRTEDIKKQTFIEDSIELDSTKEWLLALGHGNMSIEVNGVLNEFDSLKTMRFLYKDGELRKLNFKDYEILIGDFKW